MDLGTYIGQKVQSAIDGALRDSEQLLKDVAAEAGGNVNVNTGGAVGSLVDLLSTAILGSLLGPLEAGLLTAGLAPVEAAAGAQGAGFGIGYFLASIGFQIAQPAFAGLEYAVHGAVGDARLAPGTVATLLARNLAGPNSTIMSAGAAAQEVLDQGYHGERLGQLVAASYSWPDPAAVLELWRRREIPDETIAAEYMLRQGFDTTTAAYMLQLKRQLLSPAELALANLRGFMDNATAFDYADQLGVNATDFQTMIDNTGEPPGLSDMLAMWRRGIIDRSNPDPNNPGLEQGIRQSRVRDQWINAVEAYRYHPMSAADAVGARVKNYIDDTTAQTITEQNGILPEHYSILRDSYGRPLSRTEMTTLFHRGLASEADLKQAIRETDTKDSSAVTGFNYIDGAFELSRQLIPVRQIILAIQHGAITRDQALQRILIEGYSATDAAIILDTGLQEKHAALKQLTASEIESLFVDRIMTREEAHDQLVKLTYTDHMADIMLDLARFKADAKLARISQSGTRALYLKKDISRDEALKRLQEGGTAHLDAEALIDEWDLTKHEPLRRLSEAQIVKAANNGVISIQQAGGRLLDLGYDQRDAIVLLQTDGIVRYDDNLKGVDLPVPASTVFTDSPGGGPGGSLGGGDGGGGGPFGPGGGPGGGVGSGGGPGPVTGPVPTNFPRP